MRTISRNQRRQIHRSQARTRLWVAFVIATLLLSLIPALVSPVTAQSDTGQPDETATEQTVEQPPVEPTATEVILEPTATEETSTDHQPLQEQTQDGPPVLLEAGSVQVNYRLCPEGTDLAATDPLALSVACTGAGEGATFNLSGAAGDLGTQGTGPAPGTAAFSDVPPGNVTLTQQDPPPAGGLAVFCQGNTPQGNTKPYSQAFLAGASISFEVLPGEQIACDWYVAGGTSAMQPVNGAVIIRKAACPPGYDASAHDIYDMAAKCKEDAGVVNFSAFEAGGGGYDGGIKPTSGGPLNQVTFDNVPNVPLWIYEEIPTGYGDPVAFCEVEDQLGNDVLATRYYPWNAGKIELDAPGDGNVVQCDWYNIPAPAGDVTVTIRKHACPQGYDASAHDMYDMAANCHESAGVVNFTVFEAGGGGYDGGIKPTSGGPLNQVTFNDVANVPLWIVEEVPAGYGDPVVFCQVETELGVDVTPTTYYPWNAGKIEADAPGATNRFHCDWYNIPELVLGTVTIYKWECPPGTEIEQTLSAHQTTCTQPMDNVTFTLTDSMGPRAKATSGGIVEWTDVQIEPITVTEEIPFGYSAQPYVSCEFASQNVLPLTYSVINGVLTTTLNHPGQKIVCHWFNQYLGPGDLTIYKWTCPEGYDYTAWGADPKTDCTEATNGITFVLDQPVGVDLQTNTGDSINGAVYFGGLTSGNYVVHEIVPQGIAEVFVLDCVGLYTESVHPIPLSYGPSLEILIAGGDKIECHWYNVPTMDPNYGWMTVTKFTCTTVTYVSDIDCEVFEGGKTFDLQMWNGTAWVASTSGTTNGAGQLTWTNLAPGTYRVVEHGATACHISSNPADGNGNPVVNAGAGSTVKVYNCGVTPPPGGKTPTRYPNTGTDPEASTRVAPGSALIAGLGLLGAASVSRRTFLRSSLIAGAAMGGGSLAVATGLASQPIQPIGGPAGTPEGTPDGTPGADCLYPATPEATPEDVLAGTPVACARGAVPVHIAIPVIGVDAEIEYLEIIGGEMQQPTGAEDVAWYKESARLGERGNVLLAGHLNFWGVPEGVFFLLSQLKEGDVVELEGDDGQTYRYIVQWTENFPSDEEPPEEALGQTEEEVITLITCGGEWDVSRAEYDHRTLVRAIRDTESFGGTPVATPGT